MSSSCLFIIGNHTVPVCLDRWPEKFIPSGIIPQALIEVGLRSFAYGSSGDDSEERHDSTCMVCLEAYEIGEKVRQLPCGHLMHAVCADEWLQVKSVCPLRCPDDIHEVILKSVQSKD
jgi:hypothetical protein